jgi:hypothetical protein
LSHFQDTKIAIRYWAGQSSIGSGTENGYSVHSINV